MNKRKRIGRQLLCLIVSFVMIMTLIPRMPGNLAYAAAGDVPAHTKNLTDNHDGTFTLSLDVVGDSEKKPNNINVVVILDRSGSMNTTRMNSAKSAIKSLSNKLYSYNTSSEPNTVEMALVTFSNIGEVAQSPTNSSTTFNSAVDNVRATGGTNWEGALQIAKVLTSEIMTRHLSYLFLMVTRLSVSPKETILTIAMTIIVLITITMVFGVLEMMMLLLL